MVELFNLPDRMWSELEVGTATPVEVAVRGSDLRVEVVTSPIDQGQDRLGVVLHVRPLRETDRFEQMVLEAHDLLGEGVVVGYGQRIVHVNDAICRLYGYRREELLAMASLFGLFRPDEQDRMVSVVRSLAASGRPPPDRRETVIVRQGGDQLHVEVSVKAVVSGGQTRTLTVIRDNSGRRATESALAHRAFHDPLTGLPNRALFMDRFEQALSRARRDGSIGALVFLDLDGFKSINDTFGHAAGDAVLVEVAARIRGAIRLRDTAARFGGDEFVVLCDALDDCDQVGRVTRRIEDALSSPIPIGEGVVRPVASIGVQTFGDQPLEPGELLQLADRAMYEVKRTRQRGASPTAGT